MEIPEKFIKELIELKNSLSTADFKELCSKQIGLSSAVINDIIKKGDGTIRSLNILTAYSSKKEQHIFKSLTGTWLGYNFSEYRQLKKSKWTIQIRTVNGRQGLWAEKKVQTDTYEGPLSIQPNESKGTVFTINLQSGNEHVALTGYINDDHSQEPLVLNALYSKGTNQYFSLELLIKYDNPDIDEKHEPRKISAPSSILFEPNSTGNYPSNPDYLAYSILNHKSRKSRITLNVSSDYIHNILISCPVGSIPTEKIFNKFKSEVIMIKETLMEYLKFSEKNVHCELLKTEYGDIHREEYKFSRTNIHSTHFIAIIPDFLEKNNSGVYMEIFYRIGRKMPCYVFFQSDEHFPVLFKELKIDNQTRNIVFTPYTDNLDLIKRIKAKKYELLNHELR